MKADLGNQIRVLLNVHMCTFTKNRDSVLTRGLSKQSEKTEAQVQNGIAIKQGIRYDPSHCACATVQHGVAIKKNSGSGSFSECSLHSSSRFVAVALLRSIHMQSSSPQSPKFLQIFPPYTTLFETLPISHQHVRDGRRVSRFNICCCFPTLNP
jgi:hypothetical protein